VLEKISANTLFLSNTNPQSNSQKPPIGIPINMEVNTLKSQPISSSTNIFRESLVHSNMSSIAYVDHIQALANNPTWAEQVKLGKIKNSTLFYIFLKEREKDSTNTANTTKPTLNPHRIVINNIYIS